MNLLEEISEHMSAKTLPLVAITVAAVPCPDTPVILTLHWHGFIEEKIAELEDAQAVAYRPVPSSAFQVNHRWNDLTALDRAAMEAGWEMGAWDVARAERAGCARPGADSHETLACMQAFGTFPFGFNDSPVVEAQAPDAGELVGLAARRGYLMWMFRPVHRGIWAPVAADSTLHNDGTRTPPCPLASIPVTGQGTRKTVYRFGVQAPAAIIH